MAKLTKEQIAGLTPEQRTQYNQLSNNLQSNASGMIGGLAGVASSAIDAWNNVNPITGVSETANNINQVGNTQYVAGNLDNLLNQYTQSNNVQTTGMIDYKAPTFGDYAKSALSGMAAGAQLGESIGGTVGAAGEMSNFASGIGAAYGGQLHHYGLGGVLGGLGGAALNLALTGIRSAQQRKTAQNLETRYNALNDYARQRNQNFFNNALQDSKSLMFDNAALQMKAFGGEINTPANEGFTNNVRTINEGGTHEQNPYEGVPQGIATDGQQNLVEEGEVIYNDYVFSKRLTLDKDAAEMLHLKKGTSFADAAKQLQKESKERPNDAISQRGLDDSMAKLQALQEETKQKIEAENLKKEINNMPPDQLMQLIQQAQVGAEAQDEAAQAQMQDQQLAEEAAMQQAQMQEQPITQQYANGGHLFDGITEQTNQLTFPDLNYSYPNPYDWRNNMPTLTKPLAYPMPVYINEEDYRRQLNERFKTLRNDNLKSKTVVDESKEPKKEYIPSFKQDPVGTLLSYVPVVGSIGQALQAASRQPDYSHIDAAQAAYNQIPYINNTPIGIYTTYAEPSMNEQQNAIRNAYAANYAANRNSAANAAAINALNLATSNSLAETLGKARDADLARINALRDKVAATDLQVQSANAANALNAAKENKNRAAVIANAAATAAEKRQAIDDIIDANKQTTFANAMNNIGNLGKDKTNRGYRDWLIERGVYPGAINDLDYDYSRITKSNQKACGGKLKKKYTKRRK